jgi:hypothetical protein
LVANLSGQLDAQGNPVKLRTGFQEQLVSFQKSEGHVNTVMGRLDTSLGFVQSTGTVTVVDNDFATGDALLYIGEFELIAGIHFVIGGDVNVTSTNLGAAIDNLPGFSATVAAPTVTILGPTGPDSDQIEFSVVYEGTKTNYTLAPASGNLTPGEPSVSSPTVLT